MSELITKLEAVRDERSFLEFLLALSDDRKTDEDRWQWDKIEDFLKAAVQCVEDSKPESSPANIWMRCADILYGGKVYE